MDHGDHSKSKGDNYVSGPSPKRLVQAQALGEMVYLMTRNATYGRYPVVAIRLFLEPAVLLNQYRIFYDGQCQPVGYVTWAHLSPDVHQRLAANPDYVLKLSEWTEGPHLWVRDFLALPGFARTIYRGAIQELKPEAIWFHGRRSPHQVRSYAVQRARVHCS